MTWLQVIRPGMRWMPVPVDGGKAISSLEREARMRVTGGKSKRRYACRWSITGRSNEILLGAVGHWLRVMDSPQ